jgi:hypothetical protein
MYCFHCKNIQPYWPVEPYTFECTILGKGSRVNFYKEACEYFEYDTEFFNDLWGNHAKSDQSI